MKLQDQVILQFHDFLKIKNIKEFVKLQQEHGKKFLFLFYSRLRSKDFVLCLCKL